MTAPQPRTFRGMFPLTGYLVALALVAPFLSRIVAIWGPEASLSSMNWRLGATGLLFDSQFYLHLALLTVLVCGALCSRRRALLAAGIVAGVLCAGFIVALGFFALDLLQMRRGMNPGAFAPLRLAGMQVAAQALIGIPVLLVLSVTGLRLANRLRLKDRTRGPTAPSIR